MKISSSWLSEFISINNKTIEQELTQLGLEVDTISKNKNDYIIDIEFTPNRGDCLSIIGIAREMGVLNRCEITAIPQEYIKPKIEHRVDVTLSEPNGCARYVSRIIKDVEIGAKTPIWIAEKLRRGGIRLRSPVVDVTNYVLLELGQPMHALSLMYFGALHFVATVPSHV